MKKKQFKQSESHWNWWYKETFGKSNWYSIHYWRDGWCLHKCHHRAIQLTEGEREVDLSDFCTTEAMGVKKWDLAFAMQRRKDHDWKVGNQALKCLESNKHQLLKTLSKLLHTTIRWSRQKKWISPASYLKKRCKITTAQFTIPCIKRTLVHIRFDLLSSYQGHRSSERSFWCYPAF